ncbi:hypothetical protein BJ878DRAFT_575155 [Calycina marina]|uniref:Uncharacterized protein n=1 Tax=Calycina marina TaxID=1763456 RepID=A0A9P7Z4B5_9HELO|nr:hypothetical protein BJ878DRAFT_575155 [Calycina marina]
MYLSNICFTVFAAAFVAAKDGDGYDDGELLDNHTSTCTDACGHHNTSSWHSLWSDTFGDDTSPHTGEDNTRTWTDTEGHSHTSFWHLFWSDTFDDALSTLATVLTGAPGLPVIVLILHLMSWELKLD